jgi:hypothetical protein
VTDPQADAAALATLVAVARRLDAAARIVPAADDALLSAVVATATVVLDAQAASIAVHDPIGDRLVFVASAGPSSGDVVGLDIDAAAGDRGETGPSGLDEAAIDALVSDATSGLSTDPDDPTWRLADQIARMREVDPDSVGLVADWLDVLLRRRGADSRRPGS